ncbi:MAG TPA: sigma-70 family RNA polymerase sigma factor [Candidatus Acidoferrum sp.]|jgi:RNA polymerase sigma-70 factor (ECF subfamily)
MATNSILFPESGFNISMRGESFCGYPELLGSLYSSHYRYVLKVCKHFFWRQEDAEDAAAEVFLKLHSVLDTEDSALSSRPWLSKVTGRHCIDKLRQAKAERRRRVEELEFDSLQDNVTLSPLSRVLLREKQSLIRQELRSLPRDYRILLVLHYYRHMSYADIARTLNKQLPAIKTAIFRAKKMLREKISSLGNFSEAGTC